MVTVYVFLFQKYRLCTKEYIAGDKDGYVVSLVSYFRNTDFVPKSI